METARQYLYAKGLTKAPTGRGRFSAEAHAALAAARDSGVKFTDDIPVVKPAKKTVKKSVGKTVEISVVKSKSEAKKVDPKVVRAWAKDNGYDVGKRGRIHESIFQAYLDGVPKEEQVERTDEYDEYRGLAPESYPRDTKFTGSYSHNGKDYSMTVGTRTACYNCRVSLIICRCGNPKIVNAHGGPAIAVTAVYPKG